MTSVPSAMRNKVTRIPPTPRPPTPLRFRSRSAIHCRDNSFCLLLPLQFIVCADASPDFCLPFGSGDAADYFSGTKTNYSMSVSSSYSLDHRVIWLFALNRAWWSKGWQKQVYAARPCLGQRRRNDKGEFMKEFVWFTFAEVTFYFFFF